MTEIAEVGLKACPKCHGFGGKCFQDAATPHSYAIECRTCDFVGPWRFSEDEAAVAWNAVADAYSPHGPARQPDPRVSALVEALDTAHHSLRRGLEWIEHNEHEKGRAHIVAAKAGIDRALAAFKGVPTHD